MSVAEVAGERQRLLQTVRRRRKIPSHVLHDAQIGKGVGLHEPVAEVAEQRQRLPLAVRRHRIVPGQPLHEAQVGEGGGFPEPVAGGVGGVQGGVVQGAGLVPVAVCPQEVVHRGGQFDGVGGLVVGSSVIGDGMQVGLFGLQPAQRRVAGGQVGHRVRGVGERGAGVRVRRVKWRAAWRVVCR